MPSLLAILGLNGSAFKAGLDKAKKEAKEAGHEISSSLGEAVEEKLGQFVAIAAVEKVIEKTIEYGEQVSILADRLGISTDAVQKWDYALKMSGSSIQSAVPFFEKLAIARKKALDGNEESISSLKKLGVSIDDLKSKRLEDIGQTIAQAFESGDPQKLIADLREIGGKGAGEMVAAFRNGFQGLMEEAPLIAPEVIDELREAGDRIKGIWANIVAGVAPAVGFLSKLTEGFVRGLRVAVEGVAGFLVGGSKGAEAAVKDLEDSFAEQDKKAEERNKKRHDGFTGGADDSPGKKAAKEEERAAERILKLKEQLFRKQQDNDLAQLTTLEKIEELHRRRAAGVEVLGQSKTEEDRLKAALGIEEINKELMAAQKEFDRENDAKKKKPAQRQQDVNSLQRIGAYASDPLRTEALGVHKKNEGHLREIKEGIKSLVNRGSGGSAFD